jgi:hypothetical protein
MLQGERRRHSEGTGVVLRLEANIQVLDEMQSVMAYLGGIAVGKADAVGVGVGVAVGVGAGVCVVGATDGMLSAPESSGGVDVGVRADMAEVR